MPAILTASRTWRRIVRAIDGEGNSWTQYGNRFIGPDGSACMRYGNRPVCE